MAIMNLRMRTGRLLILPVVTLAGLATGCAGDPEPPVTASPTAVSPDAVTPSPSTTWSADSQAVIDAVQTYVGRWTSISQNLDSADLATIREVASDPIANENIIRWSRWQGEGWHLVGGPTFTPDNVTMIAPNEQGKRWDVSGCYDEKGAYLADDAGAPINVEQTSSTMTGVYTVLQLETGKYLVIDNSAKEETC